MQISEAKREANRRNAQKSTGPRTEAGKRVSSRNAVTHGLRAETMILGDEDPSELEARREAWQECLQPADEVEQRLVEDAVVHTWMADRARRAQVVRANANRSQCGIAQAAADAIEVEELGARLYKDRLGPLTFYPTDCDLAKIHQMRTVSTSYAGNDKLDPDRPSALVVRLQATLIGCEWMLGEWADLKAILDRGQRWLPSDKLKAVRLLGKQPLDAVDDRDVAMVFLATSVFTKGVPWYWEISTELCEPDLGQFQNNAAARRFKSLKPKDPASAMEALLSIIERATERLTLKAEIHRERVRLMADTDLMAFDESLAGERLRRYELASGRGLSRVLEDLRKHRLSASSDHNGTMSVVDDSLPVVSGKADAMTQSIATGEPNEDHENATNEPTSVRDDAPNEPSSVREDAPNEPTEHRENAPSELIDHCENAPNEPNDCGASNDNAGEPDSEATHKDAPNEPNPSELRTGCGDRSSENPTGEIVSNEPAANESYSDGRRREDSTTSMPDGASSPVRSQFAESEPVFNRFATGEELESTADALKRIRARREEITRQLNEQARAEAAHAMAARRARRRERVTKNRKSAIEIGQFNSPIDPKRLYEIAARRVSELEERVNAALG